jgi:hypothetical protein
MQDGGFSNVGNPNNAGSAKCGIVGRILESFHAARYMVCCSVSHKELAFLQSEACEVGKGCQGARIDGNFRDEPEPWKG